VKDQHPQGFAVWLGGRTGGGAFAVRKPMPWSDAVAAMRAGHDVRRLGEAKEEGLAAGVTFVGAEPIRLAAAWSTDDTPCLVFVGAWSRVLFVPGDEDRAATDWAITEKP
jgi:hypothetical protein